MTTLRAFLRTGTCALAGAAAWPRCARAAAPAGLPAYWQDHLPGVAAKINARKAASSDAFFFLTDLHLHANRLWSGRILADLIARTGCRNVYSGGDLPVAYGDKSTSPTSLDGAIEKYFSSVVEPVVSARGRLYAAKGNHDFTVKAVNGGTVYGTGVSHTYSAAYARELLLARNPRPFAVTDPLDPLACYFYRDAPHARIRYVVIDTSDSAQDESTQAWGVGYCMHQPQIDWLARQALGTVPPGWGVVVIGHIPLAPVVGTEHAVPRYNLSLFREVLEAYQHRRRVTPFTETHDFTHAEGRILFCLSGHWHADRFTCHNGLLHVTQASDAAYSADFRNGSPFCGPALARTAGTVDEQCIDCWQPDLATGLVHATRIGAGGQDRVFHSVPVEVPSGGSASFSATHLRGPLTWVCYDGDRATLDEHASAPEAYVALAHDHLVAVADGVLTAGTPGYGVVVALDAAFNKEVFCVRVV